MAVTWRLHPTPRSAPPLCLAVTWRLHRPAWLVRYPSSEKSLEEVLTREQLGALSMHERRSGRQATDRKLGATAPACANTPISHVLNIG